MRPVIAKPAATKYGARVAHTGPQTRPGGTAIRAVVHGRVQGVGFRDATVARARELGVLGWVRNQDHGTVQVHAEADGDAVAGLVAFLHAGPTHAQVDRVDVEPVRVEGHEQFAMRGVPAGLFVVHAHAAAARRFDLRLEVGGVMRTWAVPKGPSMDPAVKRMAIEVADHVPTTPAGAHGDSDVTVWDRGPYEQGGRVPWPEALDRGHAVFVLHGEKLRGGFALQRTRPGPKAQWLLIKRRDDEAQAGSDIMAPDPHSGADR